MEFGFGIEKKEVLILFNLLVSESLALGFEERGFHLYSISKNGG